MAKLTDTNTQSTGVLLPKEVSGEIWAKTQEQSAIMQLVNRVALPGAGQEFQTITGDVEPNWVSETEQKPISNPSFANRSWKGYKMAVIIPFSNEFRRDTNRLYEEIIARVPASMGKKFDRTVYGYETKPGDLFDTFADAQSIDIATDPWTGLVKADAAVAEADGVLDGWILAPKAKSLLLTAKDGMDRPLFINSMTAESTVGSLMGSPVHVRKGVYNDQTIGFAGDFTSCRYGVVEDISMKISEEAVLHTDGGDIYLWQQNMFAVLFEFTVGFMNQWPGQIVKLTGDTSTLSLAAEPVKVATVKK